MNTPGLHSLAVRHYEKVLDIAEHRMDTSDTVCVASWEIYVVLTDLVQDMGVAREAAYNLSMIYITTGAKPLAAAIVKKWLSI